MAFTMFKNEKKLPLNELTLQLEEGGSKRSLPALHEKWSEPRVFTRYVPFPFKAGMVEEGPALEQWISETGWFIKDLQWLLGLEHFRFWSTMVHNAGAIETVISFTQTAIPYYLAGVVRGAASVYPLYSEAHRLVIQVICRLVTQKESEQCWIGKEFLGNLLYRHYLVSVPLLVELLPVYGCAENKPLLTRLLQTVFKLQPKYVQDLRVALKYLQETFKTIQRQIETDRIEGQVANAASLNDLAVYTLDCSTTLALLVELYPDCRPLCSELGLEQSVSGFYDNTLVLLYKNVFTMDNDSPYLTYLNAARRDLLAAFRAIVQVQMDRVRNGPNALEPADKFLCILTECLSEPIFVRDYQRHYPVAEDLDELKRTVSGLDHFKLDFVASAYCGEENGAGLTNGHVSSESDQEEEEAARIEEVPTVPEAEMTPEQKAEANVRKVLDVLPHLGDGYVRKLLQRYGDDPEQVVAAILEGNLPPDLAEADPSEPYIPPDQKERFFVETGIERLNIYDGDELDVLTRDTVRGVIKRGKGMPGQARNLREMLDDKSHVREMKTRTRYQEYQIVCDEYDDEYDDSFDAMADSESRKIRLTAEMRNALVDEEEEEANDDEEEDESEFRPSKKPLDFCENPEVVRARYEERRRSKQQARGGGGGAPSGSSGGAAAAGGGGGGGPDRDVVGKAKGQGQERAVLQNRKHKNENKAARGNHNRKQGATFKRNKGMIPS
uniref:Putative transcription coactivator complex p100 component n=1 Tax=Culex tarsalis TaxID=7177 RepID=A0A1Q3FE69_CULTA